MASRCTWWRIQSAFHSLQSPIQSDPGPSVRFHLAYHYPLCLAPFSQWLLFCSSDMLGWAFEPLHLLLLLPEKSFFSQIITEPIPSHYLGLSSNVTSPGKPSLMAQPNTAPCTPLQSPYTCSLSSSPSSNIPWRVRTLSVLFIITFAAFQHLKQYLADSRHFLSFGWMNQHIHVEWINFFSPWRIWFGKGSLDFPMSYLTNS